MFVQPWEDRAGAEGEKDGGETETCGIFQSSAEKETEDDTGEIQENTPPLEWNLCSFRNDIGNTVVWSHAEIGSYVERYAD